jgi:zinc/manganese transport system substrate-binding protein
MTKIFWPLVILSIIAVGLFSACGDDDDVSARKPVVVATTVQITALTEQVGGDKIELAGIIPAGADAHEFEPTASDLTKIEHADVILKNGIGLDDWLDDTLSANNDAEVITVTEGIALRQGEEEGEVVDDPHVWHDPDNDRIIVDNIVAALAGADPSNRATYQENGDAYKQVLDQTKEQISMIIDEVPAENRKLVTNHDAFGYFANAFGLEVVGAVIPSISTGSEPSAQDTADLLDTIEREHVKAIFAESSVNASLAATLAEDAHVKIVDDLYGDSLGEPGSGADTVDGMLLANARKIADALK